MNIRKESILAVAQGVGVPALLQRMPDPATRDRKPRQAVRPDQDEDITGTILRERIELRQSPTVECDKANHYMVRG
jgi:hypothetical protein